MNFRYSITPRSVVNAYTPKPLPENTSMQDMRASQLGVCFIGKMQQLPKSDKVSVLFEARFFP